MKNPVSFTVLAIQLSCIIALALTGRIIPQDVSLMIVGILFLLLGLWGAVEMKFRFNIFPELLPGSKLVTSGPYRFVRHPIYSALIVVGLIWVLDYYTILRFIIWAVLVIDLSYKMNLEEVILKNTFKEYPAFAKRTKKIIPFLY